LIVWELSEEKLLVGDRLRGSLSRWRYSAPTRSAVQHPDWRRRLLRPWCMPC